MSEETKVKVLIVEDEKYYALILTKMVERLGYEVCGWARNVESAFKLLMETKPDIVLLDVKLVTGWEGFDVAEYINSKLNTPFIFMSSLIDKETLLKAGKLKPHAYLPKPYKENELFAAIETALALEFEEKDHSDLEEEGGLKEGFIFVKTNQAVMVKVKLEQILYFEADRNYCHFFSKEKKYTLRRNLAYIEKKLPNEEFLRTHKSYLVNTKYISAIQTNTILLVNGIELPIGKEGKTALINKTQNL